MPSGHSRASGNPAVSDAGLRLAFMASGVICFLRFVLAVVLVGIAALSFAADEVAIPPLSARVTDLTGTLTRAQKAELESAVARIEAAKGAQVVILMLPTTQPEAIEQYGIRLAEAWKVGRKGVDDGVIVIVAKNDRATRIEVGYGLEGALPDAVAKRIVSDIMIPRFKEGDFHSGLAAAVDAIGKIISGEPLPEPKRRTGGQDRGLEGILPVAMIFIFVVGGVLRALLGRAGGAGVGGVIAFFGAWLLLGSLFVAAIVAVIAFIFTLVGGGHIGGGRGGWGGGFGGGLGGGGFSGGGGGFGGGGASGRW